MNDIQISVDTAVEASAPLPCSSGEGLVAAGFGGSRGAALGDVFASALLGGSMNAHSAMGSSSSSSSSGSSIGILGGGSVGPVMALRPALGPTWHHCVNMRILLSVSIDLSAGRHGGMSMNEEDSANVQYCSRSFDIVKSSSVPRIRVPYTIGPTGIEDAI
jgi:hypothetical protein